MRVFFIIEFIIKVWVGVLSLDLDKKKVWVCLLGGFIKL